MAAEDVLIMPDPVYYGGTTSREVGSGDIVAGVAGLGRTPSISPTARALRRPPGAAGPARRPHRRHGRARRHAHLCSPKRLSPGSVDVVGSALRALRRTCRASALRSRERLRSRLAHFSDDGRSPPWRSAPTSGGSRGMLLTVVAQPRRRKPACADAIQRQLHPIGRGPAGNIGPHTGYRIRDRRHRCHAQ